MTSSNRKARDAVRRARAVATAHPYAAGAPAGLFLAAPPALDHTALAVAPVPNPNGSGLVEVFNHVITTPLPVTVTGAVVLGGSAVVAARWWQGTQWGGPDTGFASRNQLRRAMGPRQMRSKARRKELRPSLVKVPRRRISPTDLGFYTGTCVHTKVDTYAKTGDALLIVAPPGAGKTEYIAANILRAQGAAIATGTKLEPIFDEIAEIRVEHGPVEWFNPERLGDRDGTLVWDPVIGCADPRTAMRRAGYLLSGSSATAGSENRAFWNGSNFDILKSLLWAADMAGFSLLDVARWSKNPADRQPIEIMEHFGARVPLGWREDLQQAQENPKDKTILNIYKTLALTFSFLADPVIAQTIQGARQAQGFDPVKFITSRGTLFLLGEDREFGGVGPLFTALTGELYYYGGQLGAANSANRRLDPPLTFVLDEAALICSVPLEKWTSDARGKGITLHIAIQTMSQAYARWGRYAGETIWTNCTRLILGGLAVPEHLNNISQMCGEREEKVSTTTSSPGNGQIGSGTTSTSTSSRKVPVMTPADITGLEFGRMLMLRRQQKPVLVQYTPASQLPEIKEVKARHAKAASRARWALRRKKLSVLRAQWTPQRPVQEQELAPQPVYQWPVEPQEEPLYVGWPVVPAAQAPMAPWQAPAAPVAPPEPPHSPTVHLQPQVPAQAPAAQAQPAAAGLPFTLPTDHWDDEEVI